MLPLSSSVSDGQTDGVRALSAVYSGRSRRNDVIAAVDSYAAEVRINGTVVVCVPLATLSLPSVKECPGVFGREQDWMQVEDELRRTTLNPSVELNLVRYEPPVSESRDTRTRWPFYVDQPLEIGLAYGHQWIVFQFAPGKHYGERTLHSANAASSDLPTTAEKSVKS